MSTDRELLQDAISALEGLKRVDSLFGLEGEINDLQEKLIVAVKPPAQVIRPDGIASGEKVHE